jgi:hypothetical protein
MKNQVLTITPKDDSLSEFVATGSGDFFYSISIKKGFGKSSFEINGESYKMKSSVLRNRRIELLLNKKLVAKAWRKSLFNRNFEISFANSWLEMEGSYGDTKPCAVILGKEKVGSIRMEEKDSKRIIADLSELLDIRVRLFLISIYILTTL